MWAYLVRRLLWMIPTFVGILIINFAVLRLQAPGLAQEMGKAVAGEGQRADLVAAGIESYLAKFRSTGLDLPAIVNLRGFLGTEDIVSWLEETERRPGVTEHRRNQREKELWICGAFAVEPLVAVLADDRRERLHGPAAMALSLCAFQPLNPDDLRRLTPEERARRQVRNAGLKRLRIDHVNETGVGFRTTDAQVAAKRAAITAWWRDNADAFAQAPRRWQAIVLDTGFADFLRRLATGDLYSHDRKEFVFTLIGERWATTFWLNLAALAIAWGVAIPIGIRAARRRGTLEERATTQGLFLLWSLPSFFVGALLLHHLCTDHPGSPAWFPNRGLSSPDALWLSTPAYLLDLAWHAVLPLATLCYASFTALSRYMRGDLLDQLGADYLRTARAKGCDDDRVVYGHALRNSMISMITLGAGLLGELFASSVFVEYIFSINGLGRLMVEAAIAQDAPLVMGSTVISVGLLLVGILVADLCYALADPRIRSRYA